MNNKLPFNKIYTNEELKLNETIKICSITDNTEQKLFLEKNLLDFLYKFYDNNKITSKDLNVSKIDSISNDKLTLNGDIGYTYNGKYILIDLNIQNLPLYLIKVNPTFLKYNKFNKIDKQNWCEHKFLFDVKKIYKTNILKKENGNQNITNCLLSNKSNNSFLQSFKILNEIKNNDTNHGGLIKFNDNKLNDLSLIKQSIFIEELKEHLEKNNKEYINKTIKNRTINVDSKESEEEMISSLLNELEKNNQLIIYGTAGLGKSYSIQNLINTKEINHLIKNSILYQNKPINKNNCIIQDSCLGEIYKIHNNKFYFNDINIKNNIEKENKNNLLFYEKDNTYYILLFDSIVNENNKIDFYPEECFFGILEDVDECKEILYNIINNVDTSKQKINVKFNINIILSLKINIDEYKDFINQNNKNLYNFDYNQNYNSNYMTFETKIKQFLINNLIKLKINFNHLFEIHRTVFHPEFSYYDFVGKILPTKVDNSITYEFQEGIFTKAYKEAIENPTKNVYLVIDEINRGYTTGIFGDIFLLLDRKDNISEYKIEWTGLQGESVNNDALKLPKNLYIIGTMNTSDKTTIKLDKAFERRFNKYFISLNEAIENYSDYTYIEENHGTTWKQFLTNLNNKIKNDLNNNVEDIDNELIGPFFIKSTKYLNFDISSIENLFPKLDNNKYVGAIDSFKGVEFTDDEYRDLKEMILDHSIIAKSDIQYSLMYHLWYSTYFDYRNLLKKDEIESFEDFITIGYNDFIESIINYNKESK